MREKLATVNWARAGLGLPLVRAHLPWVPPGPDEWVGTAPGGLVTSLVLSSRLTRWRAQSPSPSTLLSSLTGPALMVSAGLHLPLGPCLPAVLTALFLPAASSSPTQEETASASAAPAFYSPVPRPPASPSRPEQHTVIHMGSSEPLTHGEPGDGPGQRRIGRDWGGLYGGRSGPDTHSQGPFLTPVRDVTFQQFRETPAEKGGVSCPPLPTPLWASFPEPVDAGGSAPAASAPRKVYDTRDDARVPGLHGDYDDDKYRRRPALGWLAQLLRYTGSGAAGCQGRGVGVRARVRGP